MAKIEIVFVVLYSVSGRGLQWQGVSMLTKVVGYVRSRGEPFVIAGDWNMEIGELSESGPRAY